MPRQSNSWSCSACSLAWIQRATYISSNATEYSAVSDIGYPENINSTYGLMNGSGVRLQTVLLEDDQPTRQAWLDFDNVYAIAQQAPAMMGGGNWYHWVAVRGVQDNNLWIANSAPGWKGIYDILSRDDFNRLGPFSVVYLI